MTPTEAVIYIPDELDQDDALYARQGIAHAERRGYRLLGVVRNAKHVLSLAAGGAMVVLAKQAHAKLLRPEINHELVGEETSGLVPFIMNGEIVGRHAGFANEITAYRTGYADGFVDSVTLQSAKRRQGWRG